MVRLLLPLSITAPPGETMIEVSPDMKLALAPGPALSVPPLKMKTLKPLPPAM